MPASIPCLFRGTVYPSIKEAAKANGLHYLRLWRHINNGKTDIPQVPPNGSRKPVRIHGVRYESIQEASQALGIPRGSVSWRVRQRANTDWDFCE